MRNLVTCLLSLLSFTLLSAQNDSNFTLPGQWTIQNHGRDYPNQGNYKFGVKPKVNDDKLIRDNSYRMINGNRTYNGLVVFAYENKVDKDGYFTKYKASVNVPEYNGEYLFDWMLSKNQIDPLVMQEFYTYMAGLPDDAIVFMYSGYYHALDQMPERFYQFIERFGSQQIRNIDSNEVWLFAGRRCDSSKSELLAEQSTNEQDSLLSAGFTMQRFCSSTVSVHEVEKQGLAVYPNPATSTISIDLSGSAQIERVEVYDLVGNLVLKSAPQRQLDISHLPRGVFIVQVKTEDIVYSSRITKR